MVGSDVLRLHCPQETKGPLPDSAPKREESAQNGHQAIVPDIISMDWQWSGNCPGHGSLDQPNQFIMPAPTSTSRQQPADLRSARWFAPDDFGSFGHRSRVMQMGYAPADWVSKPVIAIVNTWSDANQCHAHFKQRVEDVKRGVLQAGGFPLELPAISLSESLVKPTTMLYRNFLAMETEELLRSHPVDGAVLMGGCDTTTPGLLMRALTMDLPCVYLPAGPMRRGNWRGEVLGSGSDAFKYWDERRAGRLSEEAWHEMEAGIARSHGTCMTMGTAATMMGIAEAIGMTLPGASSIPAADAGHIRMSAECGRRIVDMVWEDYKPSRMLSRASFANGIATAMAMGCSTTAIIHLVAISRRAGHPVTLDDFDAASRRVPVIANIRPSGERYQLRRLPAALRARGRRGRPAGLCAHGRPHHRGCAGTAHPPGDRRGRVRAPPGRLASPAASISAQLRLDVRAPHLAG